MTDQSDPRALLERDLFLRLLELHQRVELLPALETALDLVVEATNAERGYIELYSDDSSEPQWSIAKCCTLEDLDLIRSVISRGIVAEALVSGGTVHTPSALLDPRFAERASVQRHKIEAVLCTALGDESPSGVVYLQGKAGAGPFTPEDLALFEVFARHATPALLKLRGLEEERRARDATLPYREKLNTAGFIGQGEAIATVLREVSLVAPLEVTVLLSGASGTGKTHLARLIHANSNRRGGPFVELNCAAIPEPLVESELFGAWSGAHSTATQRVQGKVAAAHGGTLLLDEIGELPTGAQAKLLQLIQSRTYYPLGANSPEQADIRVIAATNADIDELVSSKKFREDLYYRLSVVALRMPSLSERPEDLVPIAEHILSELSARHSLPRLGLSPLARSALTTAEWPGNVRQLANSLEAALIRAAADGAGRVERDHLFPEHAESSSREEQPLTFQEATRRFHRALLEDTLEANGWSVIDAARALDITRSHIYTLLRVHGISRRRGEER